MIYVRIDTILGHRLERNPLALAVPAARLTHVVLNVRDVDNLVIPVVLKAPCVPFWFTASEKERKRKTRKKTGRLTHQFYLITVCNGFMLFPSDVFEMRRYRRWKLIVIAMPTNAPLKQRQSYVARKPHKMAVVRGHNTPHSDERRTRIVGHSTELMNEVICCERVATVTISASDSGNVVQKHLLIQRASCRV